MGANDHGGTPVKCVAECGQCGTNAGIVTDHTVTDGDVEVHANEQAPSC